MRQTLPPVTDPGPRPLHDSPLDSWKPPTPRRPSFFKRNMLWIFVALALLLCFVVGFALRGVTSAAVVSSADAYTVDTAFKSVIVQAGLVDAGATEVADTMPPLARSACAVLHSGGTRTAVVNQLDGTAGWSHAQADQFITLSAQTYCPNYS